MSIRVAKYLTEEDLPRLEQIGEELRTERQYAHNLGSHRMIATRSERKQLMPPIGVPQLGNPMGQDAHPRESWYR